MKLKETARFSRLLLLLLPLVLSACGSFYRVQVSSLASPDALSYTDYYLAPADKAPTLPSLERESYIGQLERALETKGFQRVASQKTARFILHFGYKVGDAATRNYIEQQQNWGQTGYKSTKIYETAPNGTRIVKVNSTPTYGVVGYTPVSRSITTYPFLVTLKAYSKEGYGTPKGKQLWETVITASSSTPDLRKAFPYMLKAGIPYIGHDTGGTVSVEIPVD